MLKKKILLITAGRDGSAGLAQTLGLLASVKKVPLAVASEQAMNHFDAVVSDVSLKNRDIIQCLRTTLDPLLLKKTPLLCLVDEMTPIADAQAKAIGASVVLPATVSAKLLISTLRHLFGSDEAICTEGAFISLERAVSDIGLTIIDMMNGARRGKAPDPASVAEASDVMLKAVATDGIQGWLEALSELDNTTYKHCMLVGGFVSAFTLALGFSRRDVDRMTRGTLLLDIGKARIPFEVLNKSDLLTDNEMAIMRTHTQAGYEMLLSKDDYPPMTLDIVLHHHEYLDGSGYPSGLTADDIPDHVRIVTICDIFSALIEQRPYRPSLVGNAAFDVISSMHKQLDPALVEAFNRCFNQVSPLPAPFTQLQ